MFCFSEQISELRSHKQEQNVLLSTFMENKFTLVPRRVCVLYLLFALYLICVYFVVPLQREREREGVCVCTCNCVQLCECNTRTCVRQTATEMSVCVCVCERERDRESNLRNGQIRLKSPQASCGFVRKARAPPVLKAIVKSFLFTISAPLIFSNLLLVAPNFYTI